MKKIICTMGLMLLASVGLAADCHIQSISLSTEWRANPNNGYNYSFFVIPHMIGDDGLELSPTACPDSSAVFGSWDHPWYSMDDSSSCSAEEVAQIPKQLKRTFNKKRHRFMALPMYDCTWDQSIDISPSGTLFMNPPAPGTWSFSYSRQQSDTDESVVSADITVVIQY